MPLRRVSATRFVTSLMEGGSRPALVKADDGHLYVAKLRGAAQGVPPLAAEIIVGELARRLGLRVPEIALIDLPTDFGAGEPDEELRDLLRWSVGLNVGLGFVPEAVMFDAASADGVDSHTAAKIVWLDALTLNIDRTARNPNLLQRGRELFLIDHGAALYFHFNWSGFAGKSALPFGKIADHVLLPRMGALGEASAAARAALTPEAVRSIVELVPEACFADSAQAPPVAEQRGMYGDFLVERIARCDIFEQEIRRAREDSV